MNVIDISNTIAMLVIIAVIWAWVLSVDDDKADDDDDAEGYMYG